MESIFEEAKEYIANVCHQHRVDDTHGLYHAVNVMQHIRNAIEADQTYHIDSQAQQELLMTGLLHDLDDHKYFPVHSCNAKTFLESRLPGENVNRILTWISYVSTTKNGNSIPPEATKNPWVLWPRYCDRIEAVGKTGIDRVIEYNKRLGIGTYSTTTPKPKTYDEVISYATPERFNRYLQTNGASDSVIDHIYDKLLHICDVETYSPYINQRLVAGKQLLVDICLDYGCRGV